MLRQVSNYIGAAISVQNMLVTYQGTNVAIFLLQEIKLRHMYSFLQASYVSQFQISDSNKVMETHKKYNA